MAEIRSVVLARRALALVAGLTVLHLCGRGALAGPPLGGPATLAAWASRRPPAATAIALVRLLALGAGEYLLLTVTLALLGRLAGHAPTMAVAIRLTPAGLRPLLALAGTAGLAAGLTAGLAGGLGAGLAGGAGLPAPPPALRWVGPPSLPAGSVPTDPPTLRRIGPAPPPPHRTQPGRADGAGASAPRPPSAPATPHRRGPTLYDVRPGDNFWSIASAQVQAEAGGEAADPERVARYWALLVQANLPNLPVPGHPDLLFTGDRLELPPTPS